MIDYTNQIASIYKDAGAGDNESDFWVELTHGLGITVKILTHDNPAQELFSRSAPDSHSYHEQLRDDVAQWANERGYEIEFDDETDE